MSYIELTGVKGYNTPVYSIQELNLTQLQMLKEGIALLRMSLVSAEDVDRQKLLKDMDELQLQFNSMQI